jgi:hypothetical protein
MQRSKEFAFGLPVLLGLSCVAACGTPPRRVPSAAQPEAVHAVTGYVDSVEVYVTDTLGNEGLYRDLMAYRVLPPRYAEFLSGVPVAPYRSRLSTQQTRAEQAIAAGSFFRIHVNFDDDVAGWNIYDANRRVAMLIRGFAGRFAMVLFQTGAHGIDDVTRVFARVDARRPELITAQVRALIDE